MFLELIQIVNYEINFMPYCLNIAFLFQKNRLTSLMFVWCSIRRNLKVLPSTNEQRRMDPGCPSNTTGKSSIRMNPNIYKKNSVHNLPERER